jgi:hypothetical protein
MYELSVVVMATVVGVVMATVVMATVVTFANVAFQLHPSVNSGDMAVVDTCCIFVPMAIQSRNANAVRSPKRPPCHAQIQGTLLLTCHAHIPGTLVLTCHAQKPGTLVLICHAHI